ncbi:MAG: hypothetical protein LBP86_01725 [Azoarcus sp.]|jgi:hypothetical protein|nr:hypothetical protein [Azoarcus sp.]
MEQASYVFMDFDGVTHPWGEAEDFRCLPLIEAVLRDFDEAKVVISSDWRMLFSLPKLRSRFSEDIRPRILGVTPHILPRRGSELHGLREQEAKMWLQQHTPDIAAAAWCALDDAPGNWISRSRLVLTDFKRGFTDEDATVLRNMLQSFRASDAEPARVNGAGGAVNGFSGRRDA